MKIGFAENVTNELDDLDKKLEIEYLDTLMKYQISKIQKIEVNL